MGRKAARTTESRAGMGLKGASVSCQSGYKHTIESMSDSEREVAFLLDSPISRPHVHREALHKPTMEIVPAEEEPSLKAVDVEQKPSRGIVVVQEKANATEENFDHKECVVFGGGHLQSSGGPKEDQDGINKDRCGSGAETMWEKFLRKSKINYLLGRPHRIPRKSSNPTHDHPRKCKSNYWVGDLRSLFIHSKQHHQEKSSRRSTIQSQYLLVQDAELSPCSMVPPQDDRLKLLWKLTESEPDHHANVSITRGSAKEIEESIPLLGYPVDVLDPDAIGTGKSASAITPPWILRNWKIKDSRKLLRIHPEKEILFQPTDDSNEKYACSIILQNRTQGFVAFKFKGTSPDVFATKPKHGLLGPNSTIKVDAFRYGNPFLSSRRKEDLFVIMTLPVPASLIKNEAVGSFVFRIFEDQCRCEAVLRAIFPSPETEPEIKSHESENDEQIRLDDLYRRMTLSRLTSIPESEPGG